MAPEKAPAFQFYPKDFLSDGNQGEMSLAESGAYARLMCRCWLEKTVPDDVKRAANLVGATAGQMRKMWPAIRRCFQPHPTLTGRLIHPRLEKEREKQEAFRQRQSAKGKVSAANRTATEPQPNSNRGATEPQPDRQPKTNSPISDLRSPKKKQPSAVEPAKVPPDPRVREFLQWFQAEYKTRRHGADYLVKWDKHGALVKQMLGATTLDRLKKYAQILLSDKTDDEYIVSTDRGIETLSARFSWLSDRLAAWELKHQQAASA